MLSAETLHTPISLLQHLFVVLASVLFLPISILALSYNYAALILCPQNGLRRHVRRSSRFRPRKIVVTGISTPAGLRVARALYHTGHDVIGVEDKNRFLPDFARRSQAVARFHTISISHSLDSDSDYAQELFQIIVRERANLWIDCSGGILAQAKAQAKEIVEKASTCMCFVPNTAQVRKFGTRYDFQQLAQQLGLPAPESHAIHSRHDIYNILSNPNGKKYLLSAPNGESGNSTRTILPRRTVSQTYSDVAQLKLSKTSPWILEEYVEALPRITACAIVVRGKLQAFTASAVTENANCKKVLATSGVSEAMKQYMEKFAGAVGSDLSSHVTMEFCLDEKATQAGVVQQILPLNGKLVPHESLLFFEGKRGSIDLTKAYLGIFSTSITELETYTGLPYTGAIAEISAPVGTETGVYSLHHDLKELVVEPLLRLLVLRSSVSRLIQSWVNVLHHMVAWQEALYEFGDPLPLFWYTHVDAPSQLISDIVHEAWSRINSMWRKNVAGKPKGNQMQNGR